MNVIKSLKHLGLCLLAIFFVACGSNSSKKESSDSDAVLIKQTEANLSLELDDLLEKADQYSGKEVTVEAICTHICQHGGRKIFLMGSDDTKTIRVESGTDRAFDGNCVNSIVEVTGVLHEQRMTMAALDKWEEQLKMAAKSKEEAHESCDSSKKARGETADTDEERIKDFRARIAERKSKDGKDYLSFYYIESSSYEIKS